MSLSNEEIDAIPRPAQKANVVFSFNYTGSWQTPLLSFSFDSLRLCSHTITNGTEAVRPTIGSTITRFHVLWDLLLFFFTSPLDMDIRKPYTSDMAGIYTCCMGATRK